MTKSTADKLARFKAIAAKPSPSKDFESLEDWGNKIHADGYHEAIKDVAPVLVELVSRLKVAEEALGQILDDGDHITDYVGEAETPVFNRNGKQGSYCYAAAEQAMDAITACNLTKEWK